MTAGSPFGGLSPDDVMLALQALRARQAGADGFDPANPQMPGGSPQQGPQGPLLAGALGMPPSTMGAQPPQMGAPQQQDTPPPAPGSNPSLAGMQPPAMLPQMPAGTSGIRPAGVPPTARPATLAPRAPSGSDEEDEPSANLGVVSRAPPLPPMRPPEMGSSATSPGATGSIGAAATGPANAASLPTGPAPSASAPAGSDRGFDLGNALQRAGSSGLGDQLLALSGGLLSGKTFAEGLGNGFNNMSRVGQVQAATQLAQQEFGLKVAKARQEQAGQNLTAQRLTEKGIPAADVQAAIAASMAGRPEALQNMLNNTYRRVADAPAGYSLNLDGSMSRVTGGPQDPTVKREEAFATAAGSMEGGAKPLERIKGEAQAGAEGSAAGKPDDDFNLSPGQTRYSGKTNQPVANAGPAKPEGFDVETKLRNEMAKGLGSFSDVHDGYGRVIAATRQREANPNGISPASDISLIFGYMKMLDPGSVVREGEYATAKNAAGIPVQIANAYNKAVNGEFLSPEQRQDFLGQARELYGTARKGAEAVAGRYRNLAGQYGVDADRVAYLPELPTAPVVGRDRMRTEAPASPTTPARPMRFDPRTGGFN